MLMSGPVPVELGSSIGGGAQGTAIGIISGLGTMGAVAQGPIAGLIAQLGSIRIFIESCYYCIASY